MLLKGCDNHLDRSKMLKVWIEIARELREKVGNLNSYVAIVQALASNEVIILGIFEKHHLNILLAVGP